MAKKKPLELLEEAVDEATTLTNRIDANLSTGAAMLDLAISGKIGHAFGPGHYTLYVGDSGSGKTFLLLTMFAEAAANPLYEDYRLIYVCSENGAQMDFARFFGSKVAARVEIVRPDTLEAMYDLLDGMAEKDQKYIVIVDSADGLKTEASKELNRENRKKREAGKDTGKSYDMGHAKIHSGRLPDVIHDLNRLGCILAIIAQTRDNVNAGLFEDDKTRSGGHALKFYAHSEVWLSCGAAIKRTANGKEREIGRVANCKVKKNRVNGKARQVKVSILPEFGIDDTGSMFEWLVEEKFLESKGGRYASPWYEKSYTKEELIRKLEDDDRVTELKAFVQEKWDGIEEELKVERKPRYQ